MLFDDSAFTAAKLGDLEHAIEYFNEGRGRLLRVAINMRSETIPENSRYEIALLHDLGNSVDLGNLSPDKEGKPSKEQRRDLAKLMTLISGDDATRNMTGAYLLQKSDFIPEKGVIVAPLIMDFGAKVIILNRIWKGKLVRVSSIYLL